MNISPFSTFRVALPERMNAPEEPNDQNEVLACAELTCMSNQASEEYNEIHRRFNTLKLSIKSGRPLVADKNLPFLRIERPLLINAHGCSFVSEKGTLQKRHKTAPNYFLSVSTPPDWIDLERFHYWNAEKQQEDYFFPCVSFLGPPDYFLYASVKDDVQYLPTQNPVSLLNYKPKEKSCFPNHYLSEDYVEVYEKHTLGRVSEFFNLDYYKKKIPRSQEGPTTAAQKGLIKKMKSLQKNLNDNWKKKFIGQHASTNPTLCDILFIQSGTTSLQDLLLALFVLRIQYSDIRLSCCRGVDGEESKYEKTRIFFDRFGIQPHPGFIDEKKMDDRKRNQPDYMTEVRLKTIGYHHFVKSAQNRYKTIKKRKHPTPDDLKSAAESLQQLRMQYIFSESECARLEKRPLESDCLRAIRMSLSYFESTNKENFIEQIKYLKNLL
jgi:hypothetical protein